VITTCGAVTSAIIQSRWPVTSIPLTGTPPTSNYAAANSEGESVMQPLPAISLAAAANTPASLSGSAHYEPHAPAAELKLEPPASERQTWTVSKPALAAAQSSSAPMVSPWYYLAHPDNQPAAAKTTKKSGNWGVAKMLQWFD